MTGQAQAQRKDHEEIEMEDSHLQTQDRGFRGNQPCWCLGLWILPPPQSCEKVSCCCLSYRFCGTWLWQPYSTVTGDGCSHFSSKAINGYLWFPAGIFSRWSCLYCLLSWMLFFWWGGCCFVLFCFVFVSFCYVTIVWKAFWFFYHSPPSHSTP